MEEGLWYVNDLTLSLALLHLVATVFERISLWLL